MYMGLRPEGHRWREVAVLIHGLPDISHSLGLFLEGSLEMSAVFLSLSCSWLRAALHQTMP